MVPGEVLVVEEVDAYLSLRDVQGAGVRHQGGTARPRILCTAECPFSTAALPSVTQPLHAPRASWPTTATQCKAPLTQRPAKATKRPHEGPAGSDGARDTGSAEW